MKARNYLVLLSAIFSLVTLGAQNCIINAGADTAICIGNSVTLNASGMNNQVWNPATGLSCTNCASPIASPVTTTTYTVSASQSVSAAVNGDFTQGVTGFTSAYTLDNISVYLEGTYAVTTDANIVHPGFGSYGDHTTGNGNYMVVNGSSVPGTDVWCQTINIPPNTSFTFSCWVLNLVNPPASLQFSINGIPQSTFTIPQTIGVWTQYATVWNSGANSSVTICIENMNTQTTGNDFGLDDIEFSYTCSDTDSVTIIVNPLPVVNFSLTQNFGCDTVCPVFTELSSVLAPQTITTWDWDFGDNTTSTSQTPSHCYSTPGLYDIMLSVTTDAGCQQSLILNDTATVYASPIAAFTANHWTTTTLDPYFTFSDQSSGAITWYWSFGDPAGGTSQVQNPPYVYTAAGEYLVCLEVISAEGCIDSVCSEVVVENEWTIYVPNTFTPNGDGSNDVFFAYGENITEFNMKIFDRWGELIFETSDILSGWNGKPQGKSELAQEDVYVYTIAAVGNNNTRKVVIGRVTLLR